MLVSSIFRGIEVSIELIAALTAEEKRLRAAIVASLVATARTRLTGVSRIYLDHLHTTSFSLVGQEAMELSKAPRVQAAFRLDILVGLATPNLGRFSNVRQILKDNRTARSGVLNNALGEDMVMVSSLPKQLTRKLFQVPFGRLCTTLLKLATKAEDATFLLFPTAFTQEVAVAGDGWVVKTEVNTNHLIGRGDVGSRDIYNDMEEVAPVMVAQISRTNLATNVLESVFGNRERHLNTTRDRCKRAGHGPPFHPVRTGIIANRSGYRLWTANGLKPGSRSPLLLSFGYLFWVLSLVLLLPRKSRFHGFSGFHTRGTDQLGRKIGELSTQWVVGRFLQLDAITTTRLETLTADSIETLSVLLHRSIKERPLLRRRIQLYHNCSVHADSISYTHKFVKREESSVCGQLSFLPRLKDGGLQKGMLDDRSS